MTLENRFKWNDSIIKLIPVVGNYGRVRRAVPGVLSGGPSDGFVVFGGVAAVIC